MQGTAVSCAAPLPTTTTRPRLSHLISPPYLAFSSPLAVRKRRIAPVFSSAALVLQFDSRVSQPSLTARSSFRNSFTPASESTTRDAGGATPRPLQLINTRAHARAGRARRPPSPLLQAGPLPALSESHQRHCQLLPRLSGKAQEKRYKKTAVNPPLLLIVDLRCETGSIAFWIRFPLTVVCLTSAPLLSGQRSILRQNKPLTLAAPFLLGGGTNSFHARRG